MKPDPFQPIPTVAIEGVNQVDTTTGREMGGGRGSVERDRLRRCGAIPELHPQVTSIGAKGFGSDDLDVTAQQQRLAVSDPEGSKQLDLLMQAWLEIGKRRTGLDPDRTGEGIGGQAGCRVRLETGLH